MLPCGESYIIFFISWKQLHVLSEGGVNPQIAGMAGIPI